jgi:phospholipid:diacylglycerol acyltransferase
MADAPDGTCPDTGHDSSDSCKSPCPPLDMPLSRRNWIDYAHTNASANPQVIDGVSIGEGDGTVSLLSLGAMCVEGWKRKIYNPAGIKVVTVEVSRWLLALPDISHDSAQLPHNPSPTIPRGGASTSDHVDILGSTGLNDVIVKAATGAGHEIQNAFVSNIREYAARIQWE